MTSPLSINCSRQDSCVKYAISGRIDTVTAPQFAANIHVEDASELIIDLKEVDYVSSAGLRVFLQTQTAINKAGGTMRIVNCRSHIKKLFETVGFTTIMEIG